MPINWKNPASDAKLLAAIMKSHSLKINYHAVANEMNSMLTEESVTNNSVRFRIADLKNLAERAVSAGNGGDGEDNAGSVAVPSTPKKPRAKRGEGKSTPRKTPVKATPSKRKMRDTPDDDETKDDSESKEDGEDVASVPEKKLKLEQEDLEQDDELAV